MGARDSDDTRISERAQSSEPLRCEATEPRRVILVGEALQSPALIESLHKIGLRVENWGCDLERPRAQGEPTNRPTTAVVDPPDGCPRQVLNRIRRSLPDADLIVCCSVVGVELALEAGRVGASAIIEKPVTVLKLLSHLSPQHVGGGDDQPGDLSSPSRVEWEYLSKVLKRFSGNKSKAARHMGIHRWVLQRKLSKHPPPR